MSEIFEQMIQLAGTADLEKIIDIGGICKENNNYVPLSYMQQFVDNPDYIVLVAEVFRPGIQLFLTKLEYMLYPPASTEVNKFFTLGVYCWDACFNMPFVICFFPAATTTAAKKIAETCDIQFVNDSFTSFKGKEIVKFPISGSSVFHLENLPNSKVYSEVLNPAGGIEGYRKRIKALLDEERVKTKEFLSSIGIEEEDNDNDTSTSSGRN